MFKYFMIIFAFWYQTNAQAYPQQEIIKALPSLIPSFPNLPMLLQNSTDDNSTDPGKFSFDNIFYFQIFETCENKMNFSHILSFFFFLIYSDIFRNILISLHCKKNT